MLCGQYLVNFVVADMYYNPTGRSVEVKRSDSWWRLFIIVVGNNDLNSSKVLKWILILLGRPLFFPLKSFDLKSWKKDSTYASTVDYPGGYYDFRPDFYKNEPG